MIAYIIRRLLILPLVMTGVILMIFAMLQILSPVQRVSLYVNNPNQLKQGAAAVKQLIEKYGLDDPVPIQFARWLNKVAHGDLGWSLEAKMSVREAILTFLPATAELALYAIIPVVLVAIWLGVISAVHHNRPLDHATRTMSIVGWSIPTFVFGLFVLLIFYGKLDWFPPGRLSIWASHVVHSDEFVRYTGMNTIDALLNGRFDIFLDALRHLVLPVMSLAYLSWAQLVRVTRSSMLEEMRQDYVTTARAKGLTEKVVIYKHARRNALIPVATIGGLTVASLLNGVVITETVFNYRGLGLWAANSALHLDISSVLGFTLFNAFLLVMANLVVDVLYAVIDPRVRLT